MTEIGVKIKLLREGAALPRYATDGAAGFDLTACLHCDQVVIEPGGRMLVPTGIAMELEESGYYGLCFGRSGLGTKHGITLSNGVGVIDSDYRGEIMVGLVNLSDKPYTVRNGERIAQMVITPIARAVIKEAHTLTDTKRGDGGFGSSGRI